MKTNQSIQPQQVGISAFIAGFEAGEKIKVFYDKVYLDDRKINGDDLVDVIQYGPATATAIIGFVNEAKNIPKQFDDLDDQEMAQLRARFGEKVDNPNWQLLFNSLLGLSVAIDRLAEQ
jgi:hypothetical protein